MRMREKLYRFMQGRYGTDKLNQFIFYVELILLVLSGSLTLAHSQNSQMSFMYGFFFVKFLFFTVVCVVIVV